MDVEWREKRREELARIRISAPGTLISIYRHAHGLDELTALPDGLTFEVLIEAILDREGIARLSDDEAKNN
jgi:hypothetical protein